MFYAGKIAGRMGWAAPAMAFAALVVAGCASTGEGPTPEEQITKTVVKVKTALEEKNLDMLMETFAEDFSHPEVGGKDEARTMLELGLDSGYADDGVVSIDAMQITVEGDEATVYPVDLMSSAGAAALELQMAEQENGEWLIHTLNVDGF